MKYLWGHYFFIFFQIIPIGVLVSEASPTSQLATLTQISGTVELLKNPSKQLKGVSPRVLFEGTYYTYSLAKVGMKLENGSILKTRISSGAKLIYDNGDQLQIGPESSFKIHWKVDSVTKSETGPSLDLMFGRVRGIIEKGGARSGFYIRTPSAVLGVRGTDFFIQDHYATQGTEVTVLRGSVAFSGILPKSKQVEVKSGFLASTKGHTSEPEVQAATQESLIEVQKTAVILKKSNDDRFLTMSSEQRQSIVQLEKRAIETTLSDIKKEDPKLFEQLKSRGVSSIASVDEINSANVKNLIRSAPSKKHKPTLRDLDSPNSDSYEKYFKDYE